MTMIAPGSIAASLMALSTSLIADARSGRGVLTPGLIRFGGKGVAAGRAITAACAEGSLQAIHAALEHARVGDFLVVSAPGNSAYLGEVLATHLVNLSLAGVIIDGYVRDRKALASIDLSIFARGLFPYNQRRREVGTAMGELIVGDIVISPADWVVADDDGLVIVPDADVQQDIEACTTNLRIENRVLELAREGLSPPDAVRQAIEELAT